MHWIVMGLDHEVRKYKEYHSVQYVPSLELGLSQPLSRPASVPLPPKQGGGGTH
jgi:hypothetical protein